MHPHRTSAYLCYDPRDSAQSVEDRSTWKLSDNAILITATMLLAFDAERSRIDWERVATLADLCEDPEFCPAIGTCPKQQLATRGETDAMLAATLAIRC